MSSGWVRGERGGNGGWFAECDESCGDPLWLVTESWMSAYEAVIGHVCVHHPRNLRQAS